MSVDPSSRRILWVEGHVTNSLSKLLAEKSKIYQAQNGWFGGGFLGMKPRY